eukprot:gene25419-31877_t
MSFGLAILPAQCRTFQPHIYTHGISLYTLVTAVSDANSAHFAPKQTAKCSECAAYYRNYHRNSHYKPTSPPFVIPTSSPIAHFNVSTDIVDLRAFKSINSYHELNITWFAESLTLRRSVRQLLGASSGSDGITAFASISLPSHQTIILANLTASSDSHGTERLNLSVKSDIVAECKSAENERILSHKVHSSRRFVNADQDHAVFTKCSPYILSNDHKQFWRFAPNLRQELDRAVQNVESEDFAFDMPSSDSSVIVSSEEDSQSQSQVSEHTQRTQHSEHASHSSSRSSKSDASSSEASGAKGSAVTGADDKNAANTQNGHHGPVLRPFTAENLRLLNTQLSCTTSQIKSESGFSVSISDFTVSPLSEMSGDVQLLQQEQNDSVWSDNFTVSSGGSRSSGHFDLEAQQHIKTSPTGVQHSSGVHAYAHTACFEDVDFYSYSCSSE